VGRSERAEWEVREERTNRVLGTYSAATRPARGNMIELDGQSFEVLQVADIVVGDRKPQQRGWLIVSS
jgi:hypothetical protein